MRPRFIPLLLSLAMTLALGSGCASRPNARPVPAYTSPWWMHQTTQGTQTTTIRRNGSQWSDAQGRQYYETPNGNLRDSNGNVYRLGPSGQWRR